MERALEFEKFRNIGFNNKNEKLVLNYSLEKGKMGNLVIVVGANNSGKSNVLDALTEFSKRKLTNKDLTTLSYTPLDRHPSLTLCAKDGGDVYYYKLTADTSKNCIGYPKPQFDAENVKKEAVKTLGSLLKSLAEYGLKDEWQIKKTLDRLKSIDDESEIRKIDNTVVNIIESVRTLGSRNSYHRYAWNKTRETCYGNRYFLKESESAEEVLKKTFFNKYGINFFPNIYKYSERQIGDEELQSTVNRIESSVFFKAVFSAIGMKFEEIYNAYDTANTYNNMGILEDLEDKINEKLKPIAKNFNHLYSAKKEAYVFKVKLSEKVNFTMKRGSKSLILEHQSTGFKWFFNLYFNLLCSKTLNSGDILVMDEPATNLHVKGQQVLRAFLKDFAIKNDVTIVLATHSPFLIDMDNLDELRVISMENNFSHICNDFSTIDADDPDSLRSIKDALTVSNSVLYDADKVIFVEGITDYNYMVAFKNKLNIQDIVFLPIQGIGKNGSQGFKDKQKDISKRLIKINKHSPILMVDGDSTGKSMKDTNKDSELAVFALSDVNEQFITIECLFSEADQKKFGLTKENGAYVKHSSTSALFKTFDIENVSKDTEKNFKMVFDYIEKSF